jgi:hypothetical protein
MHLNIAASSAISLPAVEQSNSRPPIARHERPTEPSMGPPVIYECYLYPIILALINFSSRQFINRSPF